LRKYIRHVEIKGLILALFDRVDMLSLSSSGVSRRMLIGYVAVELGSSNDVQELVHLGR
jgi:hypothetical protein